MRSPATLYAAASLAAAAADLTHKAVSDATYVHGRSTVYALFVLLLIGAWSAAIVATRSASLALAGGIVAGGGLGNVASLTVWSGVPNPIVVEPLVFNLADLFVVGGFVLTAGLALVYGVRNRDRLGEPVSAAIPG